MLRCRVDVPAFDITDRVELAGMPGTPEGRSLGLDRAPSALRVTTDLPKRSLASFLRSPTAARYWRKRLPWNFGSILRRSSPSNLVPRSSVRSGDHDRALRNSRSPVQRRQRGSTSASIARSKRSYGGCTASKSSVGAEHTHLDWRKIADADGPNFTLAGAGLPSYAVSAIGVSKSGHAPDRDR